MALATNALITTEEALEYLKLPNVTPADAEYHIVEALVNGASNALDTRCGPILARTYTDTYDGNGTDTILLGAWPVTAVAAVTVDGTALTSEQFGFSKAGILFTRDGSIFPSRRQNVQVEFTAGLGNTRETIPADLQQACFLTVVHWYTNSVQVTGATFDQERYDEPPQDVPRAVKWMIKPYERRHRASGV